MDEVERNGEKVLAKLGIGKDENAPDERTAEEKKADLIKAENEVKKNLDNGVYNKNQFQSDLKDIEAKYNLKELNVKQKGDDYEVLGKINPEFKFYAEKVPILEKEVLEEQNEEELEYFFRAVSIKELENIKKSTLIKPRAKEDGSQRGEFGITTNKDYAVKNIIYSTANKNQKGKMPQKDAQTAKYAVLIEIAVKKGTQQRLITDYGRKQSGEQENHPLTSHLPVSDHSGNIITLKVESIRGGGENVNFMITSKNPENIVSGDPLYDLNNAILTVKIIGGILEL